MTLLSKQVFGSEAASQRVEKVLWWVLKGETQLAVKHAVVGTVASEQEGREFNPCACVWGLSGFSSFLQQSGNMQVRPVENFKLFPRCVFEWMSLFVLQCDPAIKAATFAPRHQGETPADPCNSERRNKRGLKIENG